MSIQDIGQAFLDHVPIQGVRFQHNDYVQVISGPQTGKTGSLVTVLSLEPEPLFILELESGFDTEVLQSQLTYVQAASVTRNAL
ncbi:MAG: hypothetical protein ACXW1T_12325 [Methylophilus sp.]